MIPSTLVAALCCCGLASALSYNVSVVKRTLGPNGGPIIGKMVNNSDFPYAFNPSWIPLPGLNNEGGALFVRVQKTLSPPPSDIALIASAGPGQQWPRLTDSDILVRHGSSPHNVAAVMDPRGTYRASTKEWFVTYQNGGPDSGIYRHRQTWISSTHSPLNLSSWQQFPAPMFPAQLDCGTAVLFRDDVSKPPLALATFGDLRGGNLSWAVSHDNLKTWEDPRVFMTPRKGHWDDRTLAAGATPVRLSDGNYLLIYDVDNLWPVKNPLPYPWFGRCATGWAVLDGDDPSKVLARAEEPLLWAEEPWEKVGQTGKVVFSEGIQPMGDDTFVVYSGGADTVCGASLIRVTKS